MIYLLFGFAPPPPAPKIPLMDWGDDVVIKAVCLQIPQVPVNAGRMCQSRCWEGGDGDPGPSCLAEVGASGSE